MSQDHAPCLSGFNLLQIHTILTPDEYSDDKIKKKTIQEKPFGKWLCTIIVTFE